MHIQLWFLRAPYVSASGAADSMEVVLKVNGFWKDVRGLSIENEIRLTR